MAKGQGMETVVPAVPPSQANGHYCVRTCVGTTQYITSNTGHVFGNLLSGAYKIYTQEYAMKPSCVIACM